MNSDALNPEKCDPELGIESVTFPWQVQDDSTQATVMAMFVAPKMLDSECRNKILTEFKIVWERAKTTRKFSGVPRLAKLQNNRRV